MSGTQSHRLADGAQGDWLPSSVVQARGSAHTERPDLRGSVFANVVVSDVVGRGRRCVAFAARSDNRDLILKLYHPRAAAKHAHRLGGSLAQYECERNAAFRAIPELAPYVAAPIGYSSAPRAELFLQERVFGEPLIRFLRASSAPCRDQLLAKLRSILECAHQAELFDLDLHPLNIIVNRHPDGTGRPILFDFSKVPYHVWPPNALFGIFVKLGLIGRRSRDYRHWRRLNRIRR